MLDNDSALATYYGDNTKPDSDPSESKGNKVLLKAYQDRIENGYSTPLLIFKKSYNGKGLEFFSLAAVHIDSNSTPGFEKVEFDSEGTPIGNFKFTLDLIPTGDKDIRPIINELNEGDSRSPLLTKGIKDIWDLDSIDPHLLPPKKKRFMTYLQDKGFTYDPSFVVDFLLGLKVKQFLIFCGGTGTGKTKLAQIYGQFCGIEPTIIPVGSNWTECRFITGFVNAITGDYSPTEASKTIGSAETDPAHPYFLILDEMNLSHIERYFSDILSVMESGDRLALGNTSATIGENLFILGTINIDETTYSISPKVLDRANVLSFSSADVDRYISGIETTTSVDGDWDFLENCMEGLDIRKKKAPEMFRELNEADIKGTGDIRKVLAEIQNAMSDMDLPLGYRAIDEVTRFLYAAWIFNRKRKDWCWQHYLDSQILMKILPKIHGDAKISEGLKKLENICIEFGFDRSAASVKKMLRTLTNRRYTSFIC